MLLALNRDYTVAKYLTTVTDPNLRKALTMYRLSKHGLAIDKGCRSQTWLSREDRQCAHCPQNEVETELHFLTYCQMYDHIRDIFPSDYTVCHHSSNICDLLPQGQPGNNKHHCKYNPYLCLFIFPFVL